MRLLLIFFFLLGAFTSKAQIYRGIRELNPYVEQISKLNDQLRSNPKEFVSGYQQMLLVSKSKKDSSLLSFLYTLQGSYHFYLHKLDSAIFYFDEAILIAKKIENPRLEVTANIRRVFCDENEKSALELSRRMEENFIIAYQNNDTINMIYSLNGLGLFYDRMDSTAKSLKCYYSSLSLAESSKNWFEKAFILNNLGLKKLVIGYVDSAYADFNMGLKLSQELGNERLECHLRENLGYYFLEIDSIKAATAEFLYTLNLAKDRGFKDIQLASLANLASLNRNQGKYIQADSLYSSALIIAKSERMFHAVSAIYLGQVQLYSLINKENEAFKLLDSSLVYAEFLSELEVRLAYLQLKSQLHEQLGHTEEAFKLFKEYTVLSDSIEEVNSIKSLAEMQLQFNDEKKAKVQLKEKNKLNLQIKQNEIDLANFWERFFILITLFVVVLALILIFYYRLKQKGERHFSFLMVNKLEEERGRIARDLHDGLGQSMIVLKNKFNKLKSYDAESQEQLNGNFSEIIEEVRSISRSLIPPELKRLGLKKAIENRLNEVGNSSSLFITTEIEDLDKIEFEDHQSLRIYRIIQELTTNTMKHSEATAIKIEALFDSKTLTIVYQDNGKGMDKDKWRSSDSSVGLRSILQRLNYLNGTIKIEKPKKGFKVVMKIILN